MKGRKKKDIFLENVDQKLRKQLSLITFQEKKKKKSSISILLFLSWKKKKEMIEKLYWKWKISLLFFFVHIIQSC